MSQSRRVLLAALLVVVVIGLLATAVAAARPGAGRRAPAAFHCYRPFDAIAHFKPKDMAHDDNCLFGPVRVANASVRLDCDYASRNETKGCRAVADVTLQHMKLSFHDDLRYTIELRGAGKQVHYKGFSLDGDGNEGYSVCCEMLANSTCEWMAAQPDADAAATTADKPNPKQVLSPTACPLNDELSIQERSSYDPEHARMLRGTASRPLYKTEPGSWEFRLHFYRKLREQPLGKVVIPFEIKASDLPAALATPDDRDAMAEAVVTAPRVREGEM